MIFIKKLINLIKNVHNPKTDMENEIYEQPVIIEKLIKKYIKNNDINDIDIPKNISSVALIASGSSYHCAAIIAYYIRNNVNISAQAYYASEFSIEENIKITPDTLYIFISQSGETSDTLKSLDKIKERTDNTLAVTNTKNSTLYKKAKYKLLIYAGEEKSIASTKAMSAQLFVLFLLCAKLMQHNGINHNQLISALKYIPSAFENSCLYNDKIMLIADKLSKYENAAILASGMFYPLAKEGALKIKETSYINTTAYPTGEFLHGHIAILNKKCAVISVINNNNIEFTTNVADRIRKNYDSDIFIISAINLPNVSENIISLKNGDDICFMFSALFLLQNLALRTSLILNRNLDNPFGLTKVVK